MVRFAIGKDSAVTHGIFPLIERSQDRDLRTQALGDANHSYDPMALRLLPMASTFLVSCATFALKAHFALHNNASLCHFIEEGALKVLS